MNRQKVLENILIIMLGFIAISILTNRNLLLILSATIGLIGLLFPKPARFIAIAWNWLGTAMGNIISRVLLSLVFLFICLQSFLYRIFRRKGPLSKGNSTTFYVTRNHEFEPSDLEKLW